MRHRHPAIARGASRRAHSLSRAWRPLVAAAILLGAGCDYDPDLTNDGVVNVLDVSYASSCQGADPTTDCRCARADLEGDGDIDFYDLEGVKLSFGRDGYAIDAPDATPPALTIERPLDGSVAVANRLRVRGAADEELFSANVAGARAVIDPDDARRFEAWVSLDAGLNAIQVQAQDVACNAGTARVRVTFDPALDPDPTGDGRANILDVSLVSSCQQADLATDCRCRRADLDRNGAVDQQDLDAVKDAFGGDGFPVTPRDRTAPVVTIVDPAANATLAASPYEVTGTVDDASAAVRVNGVAAELLPGAPPGYRASIPLAAGANRIDVDAEDPACNIGRAGVDVSLAPLLASLELRPRGHRFSELSGEKPFQVLGHYSDGTTRDLTLASTGTSYEVERLYVAQLSADGVASPTGAGLTRVVARNAGLEAQGQVIVDPGVELLELTVDPPSSTLRARGAGVALRATGRFSDGTTRDLTDPEEGTIWSSAGPDVVSVSPEGVASAVAPGAAAVTATNQALSDDAQIDVVLAGGAGFVRGEVYDDTRGLPLAGAVAELLADGAGPAAPPIAASADDAGRWALPGAAGPARVRVHRDGYTQVERRGELPEEAANELVDARLTPLDANESALSAALGGTATSAGDATVQLEVPAGALAANATLRLTRVSPQGLAALLPPGWSPIAAVDVTPAGAALAAPATLRARASLVPDASRLAAARFDAASGAWIALDPATLRSDGRDVSVALDALAPVVFAIADAEPAAPPAVVAGAPLPAAPAAVASDSLDAEGEVTPPAAPASPEARAEGTLVARADEPIASGLVLRGAVRERYDLLDASRVEPRPFTQDLVLYQLPAVQADARAAAQFPITPSRAYTVQELAAGAVLIDVLPAPASARSGDTVDAAGGTVADDDARIVVVPAGALAAPTPVALRPLDPGGFAVLAAPGLDLLDAFELDVAGAALLAPLTLRVPRPADARDGDLLIWAERFRAVDGVPRLRVVAFGVAQGTSVGTETTRGAVTLPGVAREGALVLLRARTPLAFATGAVADGDGGVAAGRLVTSAEFADLSAADGGYLVARAAPSPATLRARDFASGETGAVGLAPAAALALEHVDLTLGADAPQVIAVRPADGATNVVPAVSLEVDFSAPLDPASVDATALTLATSSGAVPVSLFLSADGRMLRAVPVQALGSATRHEWTVGGALRDRNGNALTPSGALAFTVLDTSKPPQPEAGRVLARLPDENGFARVDGTQGTAQPGSAVTLTNLRTRETATVLAQPDGSFRSELAAAIGDELALTLRDANGSALTLAITHFEDPDGTVALGEAGGSFGDTQGRRASVLARALRRPGVLRLIEATLDDYPALDSASGFVYADGFGLRLEGAEFRALRSLRLLESQGRFPEATATRSPFAAVGHLFVPPDILLHANLRFLATVEDETGARTRSEIATVVVASGADSAAREVREATRFPRLVLRAPGEALREQEIGVEARAGTARVDFDLPTPAALDPAAPLLLVRVEDSGAEPTFVLVDTLTRATGRLQSGDDALPGARVAGRYAVLAAQQPLAFVEGRAGGPQMQVRVDGTPLVFETDGANGSFRLPVAARMPYTFVFSDFADGAELGRVDGVAPGAGETADLGDALEVPGASLEVEIEPRGDAVVDPGARVLLQFSEPVDAASVSAQTVLVRDSAGLRIPGAFSVSKSGLDVEFRPLRRLRFGAMLRVTATGDLRARSGTRLAAPVSEAFSTFAPRLLTTLSFRGPSGLDPVHDVAAADGLAVVGTDAGLRVLDVARPERPRESGFVATPDSVGGVALLSGGGLVDRNGAAVLGPLALVAGGGGDAAGTLRVFALEDPAAPVLRGAAQLSTPAGDVAPNGVPPFPGAPSSVLQLPDGRAAVAMRDLGAASLALGRTIPDQPGDPGGALGPRWPAEGVGSAAAAASLEDAIAIAGDAGLTLLDGATLEPLGGASTGGPAAGIAALGDFEIDLDADGAIDAASESVDLVAVAGGADATLQLFDVRDRAQPRRLAVVRLSAPAHAVALDRAERLAVVAVGARGLALVDLERAAGVQPEDLDGDGVDDRILGRIDTDADARRIALDLGRAVAYVADSEGGLAVAQLVAPRARILDVRRDPLANASGDAASIRETHTAYVSDAALEIDVDAVAPPGDTLVLAVEETPDAGGAGRVTLPGGAAFLELEPGLHTVRLALRRVAATAGGRVRLRVEGAGGADVAAFDLRLAPDDPAEDPAAALFVAPGDSVLPGVGATRALELGGVLDDGSVRNRSASAGTAWSAAPAEIAGVDEQGLVTAQGGGRALVSARADGRQAIAAVDVDGPLALVSLRFAAPYLSLRAIGVEQLLEVLAVYADGAAGRIGADAGVRFESSDPAVISVDSEGVAIARSEGTSELRARLGTREALAIATVEVRPPPAVASIAIEPMADVVTDTSEAIVRVRASGSGALEGLVVTIDASGAASGQWSATTDRAGLASVRVAPLTEPGTVAVAGSLTDPASGAVRRANGTFAVLAGSLDREPNGGLAGAGQLGVEREVAGTIGGGDSADWFRLATGPGGTLGLHVVLGDDADPAQVFAVLRDAASGAELARVVLGERDAQLSLDVPAGAVVLSLETGAGASIAYTLSSSLAAPVPAIAGVDGQGAGAGSVVVIHGSGFDPDPASNRVSFGGIDAEVIAASPGELRVVVPANAVDGVLTVQVGGLAGRANDIAVGRAGLPPAPEFTLPDATQLTQDPSSGALLLRNRLIVRFAPSVARAAVETLAASLGGSVAGFLPRANRYVFELPSRSLGALEAFEAQLAVAPGVADIERNLVFHGNAATKLDFRDGSLSAPASSGGPVLPWMAFQNVQLAEAIEAVRRDPRHENGDAFNPVTIAVIQTGFNPAVIDEFVRADGSPSVQVFVPFDGPFGTYVDPATGRLRPYTGALFDAQGEGTALAGLLVDDNDESRSSGVLSSLAQPGESPPFDVVLYLASIDCVIDFKLVRSCIDSAAELFAMEDVAKRADGVYGPGGEVDVLLMSYGDTYADLGAVDRVARTYKDRLGPMLHRTLPVVSAGNEGANARYHTSSAAVAGGIGIAVGAVAGMDGDGSGESMDRRAFFGRNEQPALADDFPFTELCQTGRASSSNCGGTLALAAPGEDLIPSWAVGQGASTFSGTSGAAAVVAGLAGMAQALGDPSRSHERFAPFQLQNLLVRTADDIASSWGPDDPHRTGPMRRVNAHSLVRELLEPRGDGRVYVVESEGLSGNGGIVALAVDPYTGQPASGDAREVRLNLNARSFSLRACRPAGAAVSPLGEELYTVAIAYDPAIGQGLVIIDTSSLRVVDFVPLSGLPIAFSTGGGDPDTLCVPAGTPSIAVSQDGLLAYVGLLDRVVIVNLSERKVVRELTDLPGPLRPVDAARRRGQLPAALARLQLMATVGSAGKLSLELLEDADGNPDLIGIHSDEIRSVVLAPDGRHLYVATGSGVGSDNQPGAVLTFDVDLNRDADRRRAGIQVDGASYLELVQGDGRTLATTLHMLTDDPDRLKSQNEYIPSIWGDEPSDVAVSYDAQSVYLIHGGMERAQGDIPDFTNNPGLYDSILVSGLLGSAAGAASGGLAGLMTVTSGNLFQFQNALTRMRRDAEELARSGMTWIVAPGYTGVFEPFRSTAPGSHVHTFPSNVNYGWAPPPGGDSLISQITNPDRFASRPGRIAIDPFDPDGFGLMAFKQTGNFGLLSRPIQAFFKQSPPVRNPNGLLVNPGGPPDRIFHGLVAVTPALELDNHAWPEAGVFRGEDPNAFPIGPLVTVPSEEESFLFVNGLAIASNGGFAVATHAGPGAPPGIVRAIIPDLEDPLVRLAFEERGFETDLTHIVKGNQSLVPGDVGEFETGGGGVSILDLGAAKSQLAERGPLAIATPKDYDPAEYRAWFHVHTLDGVVTRRRSYEVLAGTPQRYRRPRGVAIQPGVVLATPRFGGEFGAGARFDLRWRAGDAISWRLRVFDLDAPGDDAPEIVTLGDGLRSSEITQKRFSRTLADLLGSERSRLRSGGRYRMLFSVQTRSAPGSLDLGRARFEGIYRDPSAPSFRCPSSLAVEPVCREPGRDDLLGAASCPPVVFGKSVEVAATLREGAGDQRSGPIELQKESPADDRALSIEPASHAAASGIFKIRVPLTPASNEKLASGDVDLDARWSTQLCDAQRDVVTARIVPNDVAARDCLAGLKDLALPLGDLCSAAPPVSTEFEDFVKGCLRNSLTWDPSACSPVDTDSTGKEPDGSPVVVRSCTDSSFARVPALIETGNGPQHVEVFYSEVSIDTARTLPDGSAAKSVLLLRRGNCRECRQKHPPPFNTFVNVFKGVDLQANGVCGPGSAVQKVKEVRASVYFEWDPLP